VDRLPSQGQGAVTAGSLSYDKHHEGSRGGGVSSSSSAPSLAAGGRSPFEYVKDGDGRTVISVTEEFIMRSVTGRRSPAGDRGDDEENGALICSTPGLRKHYEQLVGGAASRPGTGRGRRGWRRSRSGRRGGWWTS
jgi:hypothetical protein